MRMNFLCGYCQGKLAADSSAAGRAVTCPRCRAVVQIPPAEPELAEEAEAEAEPAPPRRSPDPEPAAPTERRKKSSRRTRASRSRARRSNNGKRVAVTLSLSLLGAAAVVVVGLLLMRERGSEARKGTVAKGDTPAPAGQFEGPRRDEIPGPDGVAPPNGPPGPNVGPLIPPLVNPPGPVALPPGGSPLDPLVPKLGPPAGWNSHSVGRLRFALPGGLKAVGGVPPGLTAGQSLQSPDGASYNFGVKRYFPADKPFPPDGEVGAFLSLPGGLMIAAAPKLTLDGYPAREREFMLPIGGERGHVWYTFVDGEVYLIGVYSKQLHQYEGNFKPIRDSIRFVKSPD